MGQTTSLTWEKTPFAEGATRWAFRARVAKGSYEGYPAGTELVLKVIKTDLYEKGIRLTEDDIKAQDLTRYYCEQFNKQNFANKKVFSRSGKLIVASDNYFNAQGKRIIAKGETMLLEQFIHGEYEKFNSNTGWSQPNMSLPNFFSHWTWVVSNGEHLVCDLQGHRGRPGGPPYGQTHDYYLFTDPVVMTNGPGLRYGCSDLGLEGQQRWFRKHICNKLCKTYDFVGDKRPELEPPKDQGSSSQQATVTGLEPFSKEIPEFFHKSKTPGSDPGEGTAYRPIKKVLSQDEWKY